MSCAVIQTSVVGSCHFLLVHLGLQAECPKTHMRACQGFAIKYGPFISGALCAAVWSVRTAARMTLCSAG